MPGAKHSELTYPFIGLREAITRVKGIYEKQHERPMPTSKYEIAILMDYTNLNGSAYTTISALLQYGLLETVDKQLQVSKDAINIISHQKGDQERISTLPKVAFRPPLFMELYRSYSTLDNLSDSSLQQTLKSRGLHPEEIDKLIRLYRGTIGFIEEETEDIHIEQQREVSMPNQPIVNDNSNRGSNSVMSSQENESWNQMLSLRVPDCDVRIIYNGDISQRVIDQIIAHLNLLRDSYSNEKK